jgi:DNA-binding NarL/FixJ family response regulator
VKERCRGCGVEWETTAHPYEGFNCIDCRYLFGEPEDNAWASRTAPMLLRRQDQVAVMRRRMMSNPQIARRVGVSDRTTHRLAQQYEARTGERLPRLETRIPQSHPARSPRNPDGTFRAPTANSPRVKAVAALLDQGVGAGQIANRLGLARSTVRGYINILKEAEE